MKRGGSSGQFPVPSDSLLEKSSPQITQMNADFYERKSEFVQPLRTRRFAKENAQ